MNDTREVRVAGFDDLVDRGEEGVIVFEPALNVRQMSDLFFLARGNELGDGPSPIDEEDRLSALSDLLYEIRELLLGFRETE